MARCTLAAAHRENEHALVVLISSAHDPHFCDSVDLGGDGCTGQLSMTPVGASQETNVRGATGRAVLLIVLRRHGDNSPATGRRRQGSALTTSPIESTTIDQKY